MFSSQLPGRVKKTHQQYKIECKEINIDVLSKYKGYNKPIEYQCTVCDYKFTATPMNLRTRYNLNKTCYKCWRTPILDKNRHKKFKEKADRKNLKVLKYPKTWDSKGVLHCSKCNFTFKTNAQTLLNAVHCCPKFARSNFSIACKSKVIKLGNRKLILQGYEPNAIKLLLKNGFKASEILTQQSNKVPVIEFLYKGKLKRHFPDIFIPSENLIIEVKSNATFGLNNQKLFELNKAKRKAAIKNGYRYTFLVFYQSGKTVYRNTLFKGWSKLTFEEFKQKIVTNKHYISVGTGYFT